MFLIPMGIAIQQFASPEYWELIQASPIDFEHLNYSSFLMNNLLPVTLGNFVGGGVIVGLGYWNIYKM